MAKLTYTRWYSDFIDCDWCGCMTRGRLHENSKEVLCGSCKRPLIDDVTRRIVEQPSLPKVLSSS